MLGLLSFTLLTCLLACLLIGLLAWLLAWFALRALLGLLYLGWFAKTGLGSLAREAPLARTDHASFACFAWTALGSLARGARLLACLLAFLVGWLVDYLLCLLG